jgi:hypothetical protein
MKIKHIKHKKTLMEEVFKFIEEFYLLVDEDDFDIYEIREYAANMMDFLEFTNNIDSYSVFEKSVPAPFNSPGGAGYYQLAISYVLHNSTVTNKIVYTYNPTNKYFDIKST